SDLARWIIFGVGALGFFLLVLWPRIIKGSQPPPVLSSSPPSAGESIASVSVPPSGPASAKPVQRIFVNRTPEELTANFKGVTAIQGEDRVARYIGNWLRVSGPVGDVALITPE